MARIVKNNKGFKVIAATAAELLDRAGMYGARGFCDCCGMIAFKGYYVAVLAWWMCPICYAEWIKTATLSDEDKAFEADRFREWCDIFNIKTEQ